MRKGDVKKKRLAPLLRQRKLSAERTRIQLHQALDRFEHGQLINNQPGSKLTVRKLAVEAGISKDTPLSRYPKGHPKTGEYRFPDVVNRFNQLKASKHPRSPAEDRKAEKIQELRQVVSSLKGKLLLSARVNNLLDTENYELKRRNRELEEQNAKLRQEAIKVVEMPPRKP